MERSVGGREFRVKLTLPEAGALLKNTLQQSIQNTSKNSESNGVQPGYPGTARWGEHGSISISTLGFKDRF